MDIKIPPPPKYITFLLFWSAVACFITIPIIGFYVLPKGLIIVFNMLLRFMGWELPFNVFTWAIAMYLLWVMGILKFTTRELAEHVKPFIPKKP